ncbi:acyl-CoA dehydrogenase family protein [Nocardioides sp. WS12]|uniref:acyl-CoA dehydrogenase family protein n=1 Tax=Nocardioides sp. WS12 TaxID=2486272 RepID=UPI0015FCBB1A|nr:acyl-CoA dehydrogenase family protein [Nocardioides sp. WS12]
MDQADLNAILSEARRFIREVAVPAEPEIDEKNAIPETLRAQAADMGFFGFAIPEEYGGLGLTMHGEAQLVFELGYTSPAFRSMFGTNNGIAGHVLLEGGTEEQKQRYLPRLASGEWIAAFGLTEEDAGSDPSVLKTTAVRDGDHWIINGTKRFITNAPVAEVIMVFARTTPDVPASKGISVFYVPVDTPGLTVGPPDSKMGQSGALTADVMLDNVRVPASDLIGEEGRGYTTAMRCLAHGRLHIAALCVGLSQRLVDESVEWATTRHQGGSVIAEHQLIQALIADSQTELMAARALVLQAAAAYDDGTDKKMGPACAKYFASEAVGRIADRAVQIHGGSGYMRGVAVERFYRDVRLFRIYEGTSQIQQLVIARQLIRNAQSKGA